MCQEVKASAWKTAGVEERELFSGAQSLRVQGERRAFWVSLAMAPVTIGLIGLLFHSVTVSEFALLIVGGMAFVSISRGRLLGSSVRIDARQFPEVHVLVGQAASRLGIPAPHIFLRDDVFVPIAAVGIGEPYALVISSQYLEHLREGELSFLIARELAHIASGHTRLTSLLSASGRENPAVALVFGSWLRRTEFTADRVGLVCTNSLDDAIRAISITTFHAVGRRVDMRVLAEQKRELEAQPALRMGEWIAGMPYATNRIDALFAFHRSPLAQHWRDVLDAPRPQVSYDLASVPEHVTKPYLAPRLRRLAAIGIDATVVSAIVQSPVGMSVTNSAKVHEVNPSDLPDFLKPLWPLAHTMGHFSFDPGASFAMLAFFAYSAVLVALSGQTLGMMIMELRVVTTRFSQPGIFRVLWRYALALVSLTTTIYFFGAFFRVQPHDRLSGTRLVRGRTARAKEALTA